MPNYIVELNTSLQGHTTNEMFVRGKEIIRLVEQKIPFLRKVYFGHRSIGAEDIQFPCAMVEPQRIQPEMYTTAKYELKWTYNIYFYILQDNQEKLLEQQLGVAEALIKIFSNNAESDIQVPPAPPRFNSNKFKANLPFWLDSEMLDFQLSATFAWTRNKKGRWCRAGLFILEISDNILK